jgi:hypothetical protein
VTATHPHSGKGCRGLARVNVTSSSWPESSAHSVTARFACASFHNWEVAGNWTRTYKPSFHTNSSETPRVEEWPKETQGRGGAAATSREKLSPSVATNHLTVP